MFSITIDDPNCEETFVIQSHDKEDFMADVLRNPLVEFWLENAEDDEGEPKFLEDWEWVCPEDLVNDIRDWACGEATITYEGGD
jgi:hypothetical protein